MKTLVANQKCLVFTLFTVLILSIGIQNVSYGQANTRTVRLFYFLPNGRSYRQEVVDAMKTGILEVQSFYADQMAAHGHGNMTFRIETNAQGVPIVHRVNGDYSDSHYKDRGRPENEISREFDISSIVQLVVMDISRYSGGRGVGIKQRGQAIIDGGWNWRTAAHELGHAFGLQHDFRDKSYIMSYGSGRNSLSAGAANYLAVNPYFNHSIPLQAGSAPSVQLLSSTNYMYGVVTHVSGTPTPPLNVPVRLRVRDPDGLQQVTLFVKTPQGVNLPTGYNEVVNYHNLSGQTDATVTFNYKGGLPSKGDDDTSLLDQLRHTIYVSAVDKQGNRIDDPPSWTLQAINIQQAKVPVSTRSPQVRDSIYNVVRLFHDRSVSAYEHITDAHLAKIDTLFVNNIELLSSPLQYGDFDGLTNLRTLELRNVTGYWGVQRLPNDMFKGKTLLQKFSSSSYFPFDVRLQKIGTNQFKVLVPTGAPFDIELPLVIANGSINGGATSITIPTGSVESDTYTVTRTPGTTFAVTVDIEKFPSLPTGHEGYGFVKGHADLGPILKIFDALPGSFTHLNDRTPQVRDAIVKAVPEIETPDLGKERRVQIGDTGLWYTETITYGYYANFVTEAHLAAITSLDLSNAVITALKESDFDGLTNLTTLNLGGNGLRSLIQPIIEGIYFTPIFTKPSEIFDELTNLTTLDLSGNKLSSLPSGVFDELTNLTGLNLANNDLSSLSEDIFDELTNLTGLNLANNDLSSLPAGVFDELTNLTMLNLASNDLSSLPEDIFDELTNMIGINLSENQLSSLPAGIFDELTNMIGINLSENQLSSLSRGIFNQITNLVSLDLRGNQLSSLPDGIFEDHFDLSAAQTGYQILLENSLDSTGSESNTLNLTVLLLNDNLVNPIPLTVSLVHVTDDQFKAVAPVGAPFDIVLPLTVTNGSISGSATSITIPTGSVDSQPLTVTRTPGTTAAATVDIGAPLPGLPDGHSGYALVKSVAPPLEFIELEGRVFTPVSERTPEVRDAIVDAVPGVNSAADVTAAHLAAIPSFEVSLGSSVKVGDFDGLTGVTGLGLETGQLTSLPAGLFNDLSNVTYMEWGSQKLITLPVGAFQGFTNLENFGWGAIGLTSLPAGVLDPLTNLTGLGISAPQLNTLPDGIFDNLTNLTYMDLSARLSTLPDGIFDQLTKLTTLELRATQLTSLPDGILDRLTALTELDLSDNQLSTLPDGLFSGLSSLTKLHLDGNTADPLPLTVSLEKVGVGQFKAVAPTGAPFDLILPINVTNGSINGGVTTLTIPAGSVESDDTLTVSHTPNATEAVAVDIGTLPGLPTSVNRYGRPLHQGYTLVKSVDLPLEFGELGGRVFTPVSQRTPQVRDVIVAAAGVNSVSDVTPAHLAMIRTLAIGKLSLFGTIVGEDITTLQVGDLDGLTGLKFLWVNSEQLSSLPAGVFDDLISLEILMLFGNFSSLPDGVFDELNALTTLSVFSFQLSSLPDGVFDELNALTTLSVFSFQLSSLPDGIFDGLTALTALAVSAPLNNLPADIFDGLTALTTLSLTVDDTLTLPAGIFEGFTALTDLALAWAKFSEITPENLEDLIVTDPRPLTVSLEKIGTDQFKAVAPMGATFNMVLPVTVTNGSINGVTRTTLTIPTGSVESDTLTVKRTPYTTAAVTVNIGRLPGLPSDHEGYTLVKSDDLPLEFTGGLAIGITPVSQRTPQAREGIRGVVRLNDPSVSSFADITETHLAGITTLSLNNKNITSLKSGDFDGLTGLTELRLNDNQLTNLPADIFLGLSSLTTLHLNNGSLTSLLEDVFEGLSSLINLDLSFNQLNTLPRSIFSDLGSLSNLNLLNNAFNSLPAGIFSGLSFDTLSLSFTPGSNLFTSSPGLFSGMGSLGSFTLSFTPFTIPGAAAGQKGGDNEPDSLPLTVSLEKVADGQFKTVVATGAPFEIVLPITVTNGSITGGATSVTIPVGSVESETLTVTRTSGTTFAVTVDIGTLPQLPTSHQGYALVKSDDLPITVIGGDTVDGSVLTLTVGAGPGAALRGYNQHSAPEWDFGSFSPQSFELNGVSYTMYKLTYSVAGKRLALQTIPHLPGGFALHLDAQQFTSVTALDYNQYTWNNVELDWSDGKTVQIGFIATTPMPPGPPTNLQATPGYEKVTLSWIPPANADSIALPITEYEYRISVNGGNTWDPDWETIGLGRTGHNTLTSCTFGDRNNNSNVDNLIDINLTNGTSYTFEIRARGGDGYSEAARITVVPDGSTPVSERTPQVRDAIVAAVPGVNSANDVTEAHLGTITSLSVRSRDITALLSNDFDGLTALTTLSVGGTKLSSLPAGIFDNLPTLTELYLGGNNDLNSLPSGIFDDLPALKKLYLNENGMPSLRSGVFDNLTVLEELGLKDNDLRSLPSGIFDNLTALKKLDMSYNELVSLRSGVFDNNTALTELHLYYNDLSSLPSGIFDNNTALTTLTIWRNNLRSLRAGVFDNNTALTNLSIGFNNFSSLPSGIFEKLTNLIGLGLLGNQFRSLPNGIFNGLATLTSLNVSQNPVDPLPLTVSLEKVADGQFKAVAPAGAPFDIVLPIAVTNGSISGGTTTLTIPAGSVESDTLTITRTPGTTFAVTVNIGVLPELPENHRGYAFVKSVDLPLTFTELGGQVFTSVGNRTSQVRDAIVAAVAGVNSAADVTEAHLAAITSLYLIRKNITTLKAGDFDGLTALTGLDLHDNQLSTLPEGIFDGLAKLRTLELHANQLSTLPQDIFDGLTELRTLQLQNNQLSTLPEDIFDGQSNMGELFLFGNQLTALPAGIFDKLTALRILNLENNQLSSLPMGIFNKLTELNYLTLADNRLTTLPAGIFDGPSALYDILLDGNRFTTLPMGIFKMKASFLTLRKLYLEDNAVDPLSLTVSLEKVADGQFKAVAPAGATFDFILQISTANGTINGGTTTLTIPKGSVESSTLTVTRTTGTTDAVTVDIGTLPSLPTNHQGYELAKSTDLPLEVMGATATQVISVNIPDANLRAKIESALGKTSGDPITATEMATLTSLTAQDASISNLTGLETATNLTTLKLGNNTISNISALSGLTSLTELHLWDNQLSNISALAGLTNLTRLYLWGNTISDISHLSGLTSLRQLRIGENNISNISAVSRLTNLTYLSVKENAISDISAVSGLTNLAELVIGNNTISDITPIQNLTNLEWLDMPNNSISDISAVQNLTQLVELYFQNNAVSDLSPLVTNTGLGTDDELDVRGNLLSYPSIYTHIPALQARNVYVDFDNRVATAPVKISGDTQQGNTGATLAQPFVVEVQDGSSVAFVGVPVTFAVTAGGGSLSATNTTTDVNGRAETELTLGNTAGTNTVRVSVTGITQTIAFTATATTTNTAPVFTEGASTTRTIAENTASGVNIGSAVSATDVDNDTLTYSLSGTDASAFDIDTTNGQLQTQAALDYETKSSYTVTVTVSDGDFTDTIAVTISITDVNEVPTASAICEVGDILAPGESCTYPGTDTEFSVLGNGNGQFLFFTSGSSLNIKGTEINGESYTLVAKKLRSGSWEIEEIADSADNTVPETTNTAPVFTDGTSTTRTIAENTAAGINIGTAITATDADNDTLTYTLGGTDAAAFNVDSNTGQLKTRNALDYETKTSYMVTVTVTDGSLTDTITVTISVTDIADTVVTSTLTPVSERTLQVREAILGVVRLNFPTISGYDAITKSHLSGITTLYLNNQNITSLKAGDFDDLIGLEELRLNNNQLTTLPDGIFNNLTSLTDINLYNNQLSSLPAGIFEGLTSLTTLRLGRNVVDPFPLTVSLQKAGEGQFKAVVPTGAPFDIVLPLSVANGSITGGATTLIISHGSVESDFLTVTATPGTTAAVTVDIVTFPSLPRNHYGYALVKSEDIPLAVISGINTAPTFTEGTRTTRTVAENTAAAVNIGTPITATDAENDTLTYTLSGTDAASFTIDNTTGQLKTEAALDYETKTTYTVTITVSDGSLTDTITVTINITDIEELSTPTAICEVGDILAPGESCTYPGTDTEFSVLGNGNGQFLFFTSGSSLNIKGTEINGESYTLVAKKLNSGSWEIEEIGDSGDQQTVTPEQPGDTGGTPTITASTAAPLTEATLHEGILTLKLSNGTFERSIFSIRDAIVLTGITGVTVDTFGVDRVSDTQVTVELEFNGNITTNGTLTVSMGAGAIKDYDGATLTAQIPVTAVSETIAASTVAPLAEATLDESIITLTLSGRKFESSNSKIRGAVSVSGILGVTVQSLDIDRESDTEVTVELTFNGNLNTDGTLTFTVGAGAIAGYNGPALTAQVAVSASEAPAEIDDQPPETPQDNTPPPATDTRTTFEASTPPGYTRVTLKKTGTVYGSPTKYTTDSDVGTVAYMALAKLTDCDFADAEVDQRSIVYIKRQSLGQLNNFASESVCGKTSRVWSDAWNAVRITHLRFYDETSLPTIKEAAYNSATDQIKLPSVWQPPGEPTVSDGQDPDPSGQPSGNTDGTPTPTTSTTAPLTEATLNGGVITLSLDDQIYELSVFKIRNAMSVAGIPGVTIDSVERVSDMEIAVALTFNGNIDTDATLTFTVDAGAIVDYTGPAFTAQTSVPAVTESIVASTAAPLTEAALDESIITLTLSGRKYERFNSTIRPAVSVSGISGVTVGTFDIDRESDMEITVELTFDGDITTDGTLTFTVGAGAIAGYNGPTLTAQVSVSASTDAPDDTTPVTVDTTPVEDDTTPGVCKVGDVLAPGESCTYPGTDTEFSVLGNGNGQFLFFTSGSSLNIKGTEINGESYTLVAKKLNSGSWEIEEIGDSGDQQPETPQQPVTPQQPGDKDPPEQPDNNTGGTPTLSVTTAAPLTEATLHEGVITFNLSDGTFDHSIFTIRDAITLTGISGVTVDTFGVDRVSDTQATVELVFDGNMTSTRNLTISLGADAITDYDGTALTSQLSVSAVTESVTASTAAPLTETTLDESVVTLTLSGRKYERFNSTIRPAVSVSGISGVTVGTSDIDRESDTEITVELTFDGDITT